jgi:hypothetical protein
LGAETWPAAPAALQQATWHAACVTHKTEAAATRRLHCGAHKQQLGKLPAVQLAKGAVLATSLLITDLLSQQQLTLDEKNAPAAMLTKQARTSMLTKQAGNQLRSMIYHPAEAYSHCHTEYSAAFAAKGMAHSVH